uniref:Interleukin n=1 Tax=Chelydra serpentina TaxID=8475 RepID=A0A8C3SW29_CHESE
PESLWSISEVGKLFGLRAPLGCKTEWRASLLPSPILPLPQQVCMAENLNCFHTELRVIRWEHREHTESLSLLIRHLSQLEKLRTCKTDRQCHPCEGHREQPMPQFLSKLLEQLQWDCWMQHLLPSGPYFFSLL